MSLNRHIFLIGFMGAGKTTVGRRLASHLDCRFIDMDEMIVQRQGKSISQIFSLDGESRFRDLETMALKEVAATEPSIVSTGGGCVEKEENWKILSSNGTTVFLDSAWDDIVERISGATGRPLADDTNNLSGMRRLYCTRLPLYRRADIIIKTGNKPVDVVVLEISEKMA